LTCPFYCVTGFTGLPGIFLATPDKIQVMMRLFDVYLTVDWSARSLPSSPRPTHDALWVGEAFAPGLAEREALAETYWRTRHACLAYLRARLLQHTQAGRRVLLGCDFPYGYPAGFAGALGLSQDKAPWRALWDELNRLVLDDATNANNRFAVAASLNARCGSPTPGPFWGCPVALQSDMLLATSPRYPYQMSNGLALERWRLAEKIARGVQPVWKLYGTGSAGGQALVGIPALSRLRDDPALAAVSRVWPFETGFTTAPTPAQGPAIIHAEIWPGLVPGPLDPTIAIRDQAQVQAVVRWLAGLDSAGQLGKLFGPPGHLSREASTMCVQEEGWILGAG
jgi:hypothetical protein